MMQSPPTNHHHPLPLSHLHRYHQNHSLHHPLPLVVRRSAVPEFITPSPSVSTSAQGLLEGRWTRRKKKRKVGKRRMRGKDKQEGRFI